MLAQDSHITCIYKYISIYNDSLALEANGVRGAAVHFIVFSLTSINHGMYGIYQPKGIRRVIGVGP